MKRDDTDDDDDDQQKAIRFYLRRTIEPKSRDRVQHVRPGPSSTRRGIQGVRGHPRTENFCYADADVQLCIRLVLGITGTNNVNNVLFAFLKMKFDKKNMIEKCEESVRTNFHENQPVSVLDVDLVN
jgi:hypothetical protein